MTLVDNITDVIKEVAKDISTTNKEVDKKVDKVVGKQLSTNDYTTVEKNKLAGVQQGATKNATDSSLRDRTTHTGVQSIDTVDNLPETLDSLNTKIGALDNNAVLKEDVSIISSPNKVLRLNGKGKVDGSVLSSGYGITITQDDKIEIDVSLMRQVEMQTGGRMTIRYTPKGQPSYFYVLPQFNCEDIAPDGSLGEGAHPAFIFDGKVEPYILIAAYQAAMVDGEVVSQPNLDPHTSINYDQALAACRANGDGWDLMSNLDWAAVALWCMAYGNQPYGNTYYGLANDKRFLTGIRQDKMAAGTNSGAARTLTGSGGAHWNHNGLDCGIADIVGNVWEWVSGMKMVDGNVFLAAENGVTDESLYVDTGFFLPTERTWSSVDSEGASDLVKQSLIAPSSAGLAPNGGLYTNLEGERLPYRGGRWSYVGNAGLATLDLRNARSYRNTGVGFRARFRDL